MKKLLFVFITMVFSAGMLVAQVQPFFGASVGPHFSKLRFNGFQNEYSKDFYVGRDYVSTSTANVQGGLRLGLKFGEKFSLFLDPAFYLKKLSYKTGSATREITRGLDAAGKVQYSYPTLNEGNRSWTFNSRAVHVPLIARYNLFGDRFGMHLLGGLSMNYLISGDYTTEFIEINRNNETKVNNNPIFPVNVDINGDPEGFIYYSEEFPDSGDKLKFGKADTDHFKNQDVSLLLGAGTYFNLNDDGTLRLTFDIRFDIGQTNMYSKARTNYLENVTGTTQVSDIDETTVKYNIIREPVIVSGKQKMISTVLSIGVEFCPSCGF